MYLAFLLFLSCAIGRMQKRSLEEGVYLQRVEYTGSQLGVESQLKQRINHVIRTGGGYGHTPITLEVVSIKEQWQGPLLWVLEVEALVGYHDIKSPLIRYRSMERIEYVEQFMERRQDAYQKMYS